LEKADSGTAMASTTNAPLSPAIKH